VRLGLFFFGSVMVSTPLSLKRSPLSVSGLGQEKLRWNDRRTAQCDDSSLSLFLVAFSPRRIRALFSIFHLDIC
jgi:hypothetical protein